MAVSATSLIMDRLTEKKAVHPFFEKSRHSRQSSAESTSRPLPPTLLSRVEEGGSVADDASHAIQPTSSTVTYSTGPPSESKPGEIAYRPQEPGSNQEDELHIAPAIIAPCDGRTREPYPSHIALQASELVSLEADPNEERRKRRKPSSSQPARSEPSDSVIIQASSPTAELSFTVNHAPSPETPSWPMINLLDPVIPSSSEAVSTGQSHREEVAQQVSSPSTGTYPMEETSSTDNQQCQLQGAPKRKIMKLNAKGKLTSPVSKPAKPVTAQSSVSRRQPKRCSKSKNSPKALIVVLKYGRDHGANLAVAEKVQTILTHPSISKPARTQPTIPHDPMKPTHPFFLGKGKTDAGSAAAVKPSADTLHSTSSHTSGSESVHEKILPTRPGVSSLGHDRPNKGSAFGVFGFSSGSPGRNRALRFPGALQPAWPFKDMVHVRGLDDRGPVHVSRPGAGQSQKKLKHAMVQVEETEDLVARFASDLDLSSRAGDGQKYPSSLSERRPSNLRLPRRILTIGKDLQERVAKEIDNPLQQDRPKHYPTPGQLPVDTIKPVHPALSTLYSTMRTSLSPFDKAQCETQAWVCKYAPTCACEVLQPGREPFLLRDWLFRSTVMAVDKGSSDPPDAKRPRHAKPDSTRRKSKKRRKRADELDGFVVSTDEEESDMDEILDPDDGGLVQGIEEPTKRSVIRTGGALFPSTSPNARKVTNAVLISGPHGCGKSAAAYAVAKELGFEVFEVNAGSRRNGKDILDRVGDMTRNHLVQRTKDSQMGMTIDTDHEDLSDAVEKDIESGRQGTMNTFFKAKPSTRPTQKSKQKVTEAGSTTAGSDGPKKQSQPQQQKQSLILLEEVDILFDEDRQFWTTVFALLVQSKRPVIMTCNDESLVPLDELSLHAILRFAPAPETLAIDYLLLLAANEGHLLRREALEALYRSKGSDLRASIMEVDFWCQMAVGDCKGGLDWMLERWPPGQDVNDRGETIRVASEDTYLTGMGWLNHEYVYDDDDNAHAKNEEELLTEAWEGWHIDAEDWHDMCDVDKWASELECQAALSKEESMMALEAYGGFLEAMSAVDVCVGRGLSSHSMAFLDTTRPPLSEKCRSDIIQGWNFLDAEPVPVYDNLSRRLNLGVKSLARQSLQQDLHSVRKSAQHLKPLTEQQIVGAIVNQHSRQPAVQNLSHSAVYGALSPLALPPKTSLMQQAGQQSVALDRPCSLIVEDVAPYIRSILAYDIRLETQRKQLSSLLSQGGRDGGKARTTRASRSALEGGQRSNTRRERWFDAAINPRQVARTGGAGWQDLVLALSQEDGLGSTQSSIEGATSECEA